MADACTGVPDWDVAVCCERHDRAYELKDLTRWAADRHLFRCIRHRGAARGRPVRYLALASAYWIGVRALGGRFWRAARPPLRRLNQRVQEARIRGGTGPNDWFFLLLGRAER